MNTPERSTAAAFPCYQTGGVVSDSVALQWAGLIDVSLEGGYSSPSHFEQVFRRVVGVTNGVSEIALDFSCREFTEVGANFSNAA